MNDQVVENEMMKLCSKRGIEKMKTNFYFSNTNQKLEVNVYNVVILNRKNGAMKILKKLKIIKNNISKVLENEYAVNRKNILMRIVM